MDTSLGCKAKRKGLENQSLWQRQRQTEAVEIFFPKYP